MKIPNFEVVELRTSFDDGFVEYFTRADDTALDLNAKSILIVYGKQEERFGNLEGWSAVGSLNKAFSIEDKDTIVLKATSPSYGKVFEIFKDLVATPLDMIVLI